MMKSFDEISNFGKCDCCGNKTQVIVCSSSCGSISFSYCKECYINGYEPYFAMVAYISSILAYGTEETYKEKVSEKYLEFIERNLKFHSKSEEEFIFDMHESNRKLIELMKKDLESG